jgi:TolB-like protein
LRQALFRLRRVLGQDVLLSDGEEVSLTPDDIACDATQLEVLVGQGTRTALTESVELYKSRLLVDIGITEQGWSEWLDSERVRLEGLALDAMVKLGDLELEAGFSEQALAAANKAISINNLREDAHRLAIRALAAAGRRADALKRYEHLVALLKSELDVEPDANTQALVRSLRQPNLAPSDPVARGDPPPRAPSEFPPLPDRPSIAVLPFANMSGDPEQEYFADGMVEDILTALSHVRWLFVIARQSTFSYKGRAVDVKQIGRELGVRYVTEGSVRKFGNRVRVTAQLSTRRRGPISGPIASKGCSRTSSSFRTTLHPLSRVPSSRRCKRRSVAAQSGGRPMTSPHTTLYCAPAATAIPGKSKS